MGYLCPKTNKNRYTLLTCVKFCSVNSNRNYARSNSINELSATKLLSSTGAELLWSSAWTLHLKKTRVKWPKACQLNSFLSENESCLLCLYQTTFHPYLHNAKTSPEPCTIWKIPFCIIYPNATELVNIKCNMPVHIYFFQVLCQYPSCSARLLRWRIEAKVKEVKKQSRDS